VSVMVAAGVTRPLATGAWRVRRWDVMTMEMKITTHDLVSVAKGRALMCAFTTGEEGLLRPDGAALDPDSLAEARAIEDGLPVVPLTRDNIDVIAHGKTAIVLANDPGAGSYRVLVQLMTPEELLEAHAAACRKYGGKPTMSYDEAVRLTEHL
jgi:hypothetical protein